MAAPIRKGGGKSVLKSPLRNRIGAVNIFCQAYKTANEVRI